MRNPTPVWRAVRRQTGRARAEQVRLLELLVYGEFAQLSGESPETSEHPAPGQRGPRDGQPADLAGAGELDELTELAE